MFFSICRPSVVRVRVRGANQGAVQARAALGGDGLELPFGRPAVGVLLQASAQRHRGATVFQAVDVVQQQKGLRVKVRGVVVPGRRHSAGPRLGVGVPGELLCDAPTAAAVFALHAADGGPVHTTDDANVRPLGPRPRNLASRGT